MWNLLKKNNACIGANFCKMFIQCMGRHLAEVPVASIYV